MFQERFVDLVASGAKPHTIRLRARCKPADRLSLRTWTGKAYRSRQRIIREVTCTRVDPVTITDEGISIYGAALNAEAVAKADGFASWADMRAWFSDVHGLPFHGQLIGWQAG
jgi:hypothetical protein